MKQKILFCTLFILLGCKSNKEATDDILTLGTFNMEWLGDGISDMKDRNDSNLQQIADILTLSGMELIAVQEVENSAAAQRIIEKMDGFNFKLSQHNSKQKVGIIYKEDDIDVYVVGDYAPLVLKEHGYNMRPGFVVKIQKDDIEMVAMVVHLKSTSRYDSTIELKETSRKIRALQAGVLNKWVDSILSISPKQQIVVMGDFNDYPNRKHNQTLYELAANPKLHFLTLGQKSCKFQFSHSIDHIMVSDELKENYIDGSIFQLDFNAMLSDKEADDVSDHCPVLAQFRIKSTQY